jgi:hypothetical protein
MNDHECIERTKRFCCLKCFFNSLFYSTGWMKPGIELLLFLATGIFKRKAMNESLVRWQLHVSFCFLSRHCSPIKGNYLMVILNKHFLKTNNSLIFCNIFTNSNRLVILLAWYSTRTLIVFTVTAAAVAPYFSIWLSFLVFPFYTLHFKILFF